MSPSRAVLLLALFRDDTEGSHNNLKGFAQLHNALCKAHEWICCFAAQGHGVSIGSETSGWVRNITIRDSTLHGTNLAVRIKTMRGPCAFPNPFNRVLERILVTKSTRIDAASHGQAKVETCS